MTPVDNNYRNIDIYNLTLKVKINGVKRTLSLTKKYESIEKLFSTNDYEGIILL